MDISHSPWLWMAWFVILWLVVSLSIGWIGGWVALTRNYRTLDRYEDKRWRFQSAQMRWGANYNSCLTVGANDQGLNLEAMIFLRVGHPRLFIPWRDISIRQKKFLGIKRAELRLGRETPIPFRIRERLADRLREAAGKSWPVEAAG